MVDHFREALEQYAAKGSRSTALKPIHWYLGVTGSVALGSIQLSAPTWITLVCVSVFGLGAVMFLAAYTYFALKNPDALRSEKYVLGKMAMEKSLMGDNLAGLTTAAPGEIDEWPLGQIATGSEERTNGDR